MNRAIKYERATGEYVADINNWDGGQPEDNSFGITDILPDTSIAVFKHIFDVNIQSWDEGMPQAELDALKAEQALSQCVAQRKARYEKESDPLYLDIIYDTEKAGVKPDLTTWVAVKDKIKAEIPKP